MSQPPEQRPDEVSPEPPLELEPVTPSLSLDLEPVAPTLPQNSDPVAGQSKEKDECGTGAPAGLEIDTLAVPERVNPIQSRTGEGAGPTLGVAAGASSTITASDGRAGVFLSHTLSRSVSLSLVIGCLAAALGAGYIALRAYAALVFPYQIDPEEGFLLNQAMLLSQGVSWYRPIDEAPFIAGTYAPLFQALTARGPLLICEILIAIFLGAIIADLGERRAACGVFAGLAFVFCAELTALRMPRTWQGKEAGDVICALLPAVICALASAFAIVVAARRSGFAPSMLAAGAFLSALALHGRLLAPALGSWAPMTMMAARTTAILSEVVCALVVGATVFRLGRRSLVAALFAGLLFLVCNEGYQWTGFARVDYTALAFSLLGLTALSFGMGAGTLVLAGLCFVGVAFTKQSQIMAPLAACLFLLWRRPRVGLVFIVALGVSVALVAVALHVATAGQYLRHTVLFNANEFHWDQLFKVYIPHIWRFKFLVAIALAVAVAGHVVIPLIDRKKAPDNDERADWTPFYLALCLLSLVGFAKAGVSYNYWLEPWAAFLIYLGVRVGKAADASRWPESAAGLVVAVLLVAHSFFVLTQMPGYPSSMDSPFRPRFTITASNPGQDDLRKGRMVESMIDQTVASGGDVLTELPIFEIRQGGEAHWQPFIMAQLAREGKWDDSPVVEAFRAARYDLIVTTSRLEDPDAYYANYTDAMLQALRQSYRRAGSATGGPHIFDYHFYVPRR